MFATAENAPKPQADWNASLTLAFARAGNRTVLARRSHSGPLVIQKILNPEGPDICHAVIVHPPGGIAGGDTLGVVITLEADAAVLVTTPAATKWYKSGGRESRQAVRLTLGRDAALEWLPQEAIVYDGS